MNFKEFKNKYLKVAVEEYSNNRKDKKPIVTVKVVTYNHVNFIAQCLDSILMQVTNFDFEILIAEDDSNDGTREICKKYADKYPNKIKLLLNSRKNNILIDGRATGTFNNTYANYCIKSKYISIIEGDDYWTDKLSLQKRVKFLENNEDYVLCFHNAKIYNQRQDKFKKEYLVRFKESVSIEKEEILNTYVPTLTLLYRNNKVKLFEENMINIITGDFILRGKLANFGKARYIHEIKPSIYRVHKGGIFSGSNFKDNKKAIFAAKFYLLKFYEERNWDLGPINQSLAEMFISYFFKEIRNNKIIKSNYFFQSLAYSKKSNISFFKICKNVFYNKKSVKALIWKLRYNKTWKL